jgi:hypothetical protein
MCYIKISITTTRLFRETNFGQLALGHNITIQMLGWMANAACWGI